MCFIISVLRLREGGGGGGSKTGSLILVWEIVLFCVVKHAGIGSGSLERRTNIATFFLFWTKKIFCQNMNGSKFYLAASIFRYIFAFIIYLFTSFPVRSDMLQEPLCAIYRTAKLSPKKFSWTLIESSLLSIRFLTWSHSAWVLPLKNSSCAGQIYSTPTAEVKTS